MAQSAALISIHTQSERVPKAQVVARAKRTQLLVSFEEDLIANLHQMHLMKIFLKCTSGWN